MSQNPERCDLPILSRGLHILAVGYLGKKWDAGRLALGGWICKVFKVVSPPDWFRQSEWAHCNLVESCSELEAKVRTCLGLAAHFYNWSPRIWLLKLHASKDSQLHRLHFFAAKSSKLQIRTRLYLLNCRGCIYLLVWSTNFIVLLFPAGVCSHMAWLHWLQFQSSPELKVETCFGWTCTTGSILRHKHTFTIS